MTAAIALAKAVLCQDCNSITETTDKECAKCGSIAVVNLQKMLDGKPTRIVDESTLGKLVVARTCQGLVQVMGVCIAYTDKPTVLVAGIDGQRVNWRADMCEVVPVPEDAEALLAALSAGLEVPR